MLRPGGGIDGRRWSDRCKINGRGERGRRVTSVIARAGRAGSKLRLNVESRNIPCFSGEHYPRCTDYSVLSVVVDTGRHGVARVNRKEYVNLRNCLILGISGLPNSISRQNVYLNQ